MITEASDTMGMRIGAISMGVIIVEKTMKLEAVIAFQRN